VLINLSLFRRIRKLVFSNPFATALTILILITKIVFFFSVQVYIFVLNNYKNAKTSKGLRQRKEFSDDTHIGVCVGDCYYMDYV